LREEQNLISSKRKGEEWLVPEIERGTQEKRDCIEIINEIIIPK
jgi:hypothetical protein